LNKNAGELHYVEGALWLNES